MGRWLGRKGGEEGMRAGPHLNKTSKSRARQPLLFNNSKVNDVVNLISNLPFCQEPY